MSNQSKQPGLTSKDVARILDCSPDDAVKLVHKGMLKATKEGRVWKYHPVTVQAYRKQTKRRE